MSEHKRHKHHGSYLPSGCGKRTLLFGGYRYARKGDQWFRQCRKYPNRWHDEDDGGVCNSLKIEWDYDEPTTSSSADSAGDSKPKKKGSRSDDLKETGKDSHGRNWYYDDASKGGQRYYFILGMFRKAKKPRCAEVEIITSKGKATHLLGEREMTMLLKQVNKVFGRLYGKTKLLKVVLPDSRVIQ